jgi:similar to stage IV sporulation protein
LQDGFIKKYINKITGYVVVIVEGFFLEKFTNLCANNNISFWNLSRIGNSKMRIETNIKDFKKMRKQAKKCGCRISLSEKRGLPFLLFRYRKRKWFAAGVAFFFIIVWVLSSIVWTIDIQGNKLIDTSLIISDLEKVGLKKGTFKRNINKVDLAYKMMLKRDDISFIGIDIEGTKAKVKIVEKVKVPDVIPKDEPCDIVADKTGIISRMEVLAGEKLVKIGDTVSKGQLLILGKVEMKNFPEKTEEVHSMAKIMARVWYEESERLTVFEELGLDKCQLFAYRIAYDKINRKVPDEIEIVDEKTTYTYGDGYVEVNIIVETLEDIALQVKRSN